MSDRWLDRPWWRRGLLYHLYLVVLKDNGIRVRRAAHWSRVLARVWLRTLVRYLTGRWALVPQLVRRETLIADFRRRIIAVMELQRERRKDNRDLLTGMVVALLAGPNLPPWSGWEHYRAHLGRRKRTAKGSGKLVGRPVVYKNEHGVKLGMTEFAVDYVPRQEYLAGRKAARQAARQLKEAA